MSSSNREKPWRFSIAVIFICLVLIGLLYYFYLHESSLQIEGDKLHRPNPWLEFWLPVLTNVVASLTAIAISFGIIRWFVPIEADAATLDVVTQVGQLKSEMGDLMKSCVELKLQCERISSNEDLLKGMMLLANNIFELRNSQSSMEEERGNNLEIPRRATLGKRNSKDKNNNI